MKKFSRRVSFPVLRHSPSKKSLNIEELPKNASEGNFYSSGVNHVRSSSTPDSSTNALKGERPVSLFCDGFDDIKFTSPLNTMDDDGISVLESSEEVILPPPTGFGDDCESESSDNHDYEEIPHDVPLEPYLATLHSHSSSSSASASNCNSILVPVVEDFDPSSLSPPVICGDQSLLDEIEASHEKTFGPTSVRFSTILNEFDPLRSGSRSNSGESRDDDEPYYATVRSVRTLEKALTPSPSLPPPVDFSTMPRDSVYSCYSDSGSSGFEDSVKDVLPKFEESLSISEGNSPLTGFRLIPMNRSTSSPSLEGYLHHFNEDKKDFTKLWCALKDGFFNPFSAPVSKVKIGKKWCLETKYISIVCSVDGGTLGCESNALSFFEISTLFEMNQGNKSDRKIFGAILESQCMLWVLNLLKGVANERLLKILEDKFSDFSIIGSVYYKENVSGYWNPAWLLLCGSEFYLEGNEGGRFMEVDMRKVRSVEFRSVEDAGNATGVCDKGTVFVLTLAKSTLYFQSVYLRDTKNWHSRLCSAWELCGKGPDLDRFFLTEDDVPIVVDKCVQFVATHGFASEGIYRKSATTSKTSSVLERLRKDPWGTILTGEEYTEHDVANALKRFFRTLPCPLMTEEFCHLWLATAGIPAFEEKMKGYEKLLAEMPVVNRSTLKKLIWHLHSIDSQKEQNSMPAKNLSPIWGPTLMTVEGADTTSHGGFDQTSEESIVVLDLIQNFPRLFTVSDEALAKEARIISALSRIKEGPKFPKHSGDYRVWVYLHNARFGRSVSITVTPTLTGGDLCARFIREDLLQGKLSEFSVFEVLLDGELERPLHHSEKILSAVVQWTSWDEPYRAKNVLVLKKNDLYPKISEYQALQPMSNLAELDYADRKMKAFKPLVFDYSNAILKCFKDDREAQNSTGTPLHEWKIEDIIWYLGAEAKRNPPHKWSITFVDKDSVIKKTKDQKWFGHTLAFRSEEVMLRWLSSFLYSKHRSGLVPLSPPEEDLLS